MQTAGDKERTLQQQGAQLKGRVDSLERELAAARQERSDAGAAASGQLAELQARLSEAYAARQAEQLAFREELTRAKVDVEHVCFMLPEVPYTWRHGLPLPIPLMCCSCWRTPLSKEYPSARQRARRRHSMLLRAASRRWRLLRHRLRSTLL